MSDDTEGLAVVDLRYHAFPPCERCDGWGRVPCPLCDGDDTDCENCDGWGRVPCPECEDRGYRAEYCSECFEQIDPAWHRTMVVDLVAGEVYCDRCRAD